MGIKVRLDWTGCSTREGERVLSSLVGVLARPFQETPLGLLGAYPLPAENISMLQEGQHAGFVGGDELPLFRFPQVPVQSSGLTPDWTRGHSLAGGDS